MTQLSENGAALMPGVNVDVIDVGAGLRKASDIGYDGLTDQMIVQHALMLWRRGEEASAERLWVHTYPRDLTSWYMILAAARASGEEALGQEVDGAS